MDRMLDKEEKPICKKCGNPVLRPTPMKCSIDKNYYCDNCIGKPKISKTSPYFKLV